MRQLMTRLRARPLSTAASLTLLLAGSTALLGWYFDQPLMRSLVPGAVQMKPNAALGLVAAGVAMLPLGAEGTRWSERLRHILAVCVLLIGALTLAQYLSGTDLGIDQLLFTDEARAFNPLPGRMSPFSAWALVLLGSCLYLQGRPGWARAGILTCSVQVIVIGAVALLGYAWNAAELVTNAWLPPVAANTAGVLIVAGLALLIEHGADTRRPPGQERLTPVERRLVLGFWAMVLVLVVAATFTYRSNLQYVRAATLVAHTQSTRAELARLESCMAAAQAHQREYTLAGDNGPRSALHDAIARCKRLVRSIHTLVSDDASQRKRVEALVQAALRHLQMLQAGADLFESGNHYAARQVIAVAAGEAALQQVSGVIDQLETVEEGLLASREHSQALGRAVMLVSLMLMLLVASAIFALLVRGMRVEIGRSRALRDEAGRQQTLLQTVINSIPDFIAYKNVDGVYLGCNDAYTGMFGLSADQVVGRKLGDLFPSSRADAMRARDDEVLALQEKRVDEDCMTFADGSRVPMEVVRTPLRGPDGQLGGLLAIGRNVTHREQVAQEIIRARELAEQAARAKTEFLANMSHEIRTPMTGVLGMIDILAGEELTPVQLGYVELMRTSGRHLLNVINDILDFSRVETGKLELEHIDYAVPELRGRLQSLTQHLAVERGVALQFHFDSALPEVLQGDPTRLTQVLLNLVTNAIKFTERGAVTVRARRAPTAETGTRLLFEVSDTGVGIPADVLSQLFEPFVQADSSTARKHGGSGLGLAICKRLVEAMGGVIGASSEPGAGSCFFFDIPLVPGSAQALQPEANRVAPPLPRRILIAEDLEINRNILQAGLRKDGHELVFASNGEEAIRLVRDGVFDLVLMDVQMPVMDGVEATRRIRAMGGAASRLPIVGLTANVMARERDLYLRAGMDECLNKPIDWRELSAVISRRALLPGAGSMLVDSRALAALRRVAGEVGMQELVRDGFDAYRQYCAEMDSADQAGLGSIAHKISGSAGTLGLHWIGDAAARIEAAVKGGRDGAALVAELQRAIETTREELLKLGILQLEGVAPQTDPSSSPAP
jgi:PAS domain S-box-containing protein